MSESRAFHFDLRHKLAVVTEANDLKTLTLTEWQVLYLLVSSDELPIASLAELLNKNTQTINQHLRNAAKSLGLRPTAGVPIHDTLKDNFGPTVTTIFNHDDLKFTQITEKATSGD